MTSKWVRVARIKVASAQVDSATVIANIGLVLTLIATVQRTPGTARSIRLLGALDLLPIIYKPDPNPS